MYLCPTTVKQVMKKKKLNVHTLSHKPVAKISAIVFYTLLGMSALLFVLFRLVGFDMPYFENPEYNAPLLTGVLISYMLLLVAVALVLAVYSFVRSARINRKENRVVNNIPAHRIAVATVVGTAALLALTFGSADGERRTLRQRYRAACIGHVYRHIIGFDSYGNSRRSLWRNT